MQKQQGVISGSPHPEREEKEAGLGRGRSRLHNRGFSEHHRKLSHGEDFSELPQMGEGDQVFIAPQSSVIGCKLSQEGIVISGDVSSLELMQSSKRTNN